MPRKSQRIIVLDSWAVLAFLLKEAPAAFDVRDMILAAAEGGVALHMSWVNAGEVYYRVIRERGMEQANSTMEKLPGLGVALHEPGRQDILAAASLKSRHKISFADGFALALAAKLGGAVATGDPELCALSAQYATIELSRGHQS